MYNLISFLVVLEMLIIIFRNKVDFLSYRIKSVQTLTIYYKNLFKININSYYSHYSAVCLLITSFPALFYRLLKSLGFSVDFFMTPRCGLI